MNNHPAKLKSRHILIRFVDFSVRHGRNLHFFKQNPEITREDLNKALDDFYLALVDKNFSILKK